MTSVTRRVMLPRVIKSFASRAAERLFERERVPGLPPDVQRAALRKLRQLDAATRGSRRSASRPATAWRL